MRRLRLQPWADLQPVNRVVARCSVCKSEPQAPRAEEDLIGPIPTVDWRPSYLARAQCIAVGERKGVIHVAGEHHAGSSESSGIGDRADREPLVAGLA